MRHRTTALVAAALLTALVGASCTRRGGGIAGSGGGAIPGPAAGQKDCGTITKDSSVSTEDRTAASCFNEYHQVVNRYVKIVSGDQTMVVSAIEHSVTITQATGNSVTSRTNCGDGGGDSQFLVHPEGTLEPLVILGNNCQYPGR
jgi:hypothetical protein